MSAEKKSVMIVCAITYLLMVGIGALLSTFLGNDFFVGWIVGVTFAAILRVIRETR